VTPDKKIVWKYLNPAKGGFGPGGPGGPGGPPRPGQILPAFLQDGLKLTPEQKKDLDAFQKEIDGKLKESLTEAQRKQLDEGTGMPPGPGGPPGGFSAPAQPGQLMATTTQIRLKPTTEQKKQLSDLQKAVDAKLDKLLTADQKKQFQEMKKDFARGGPPGAGPGGPGGPGGPRGPGGPGGPGGGPPAFLFAGPPGGASLFRAYRYGTEYAGLAGRDLKPGKTIEELEKKEPEKK